MSAKPQTELQNKGFVRNLVDGAVKAKNGFIQTCSKVKDKTIEYKNEALAAMGFLMVGNPIAGFSVPIAAPDMTDATGSVTNVFGAVLGVAVLIFGFKKIRSLL